MIRSAALILGIGAIFALQPVQASAQAGRQAPQNLTRQEMMQRIQQQFEERVARELSLDDQQRTQLTAVFREFGQERAQLLPRRMQLARDVRDLLAGSPSDERAMQLIQESRELRSEEARLRQNEEDRLLEVLSPTQVLRLQSLRDQFGEQIRRLGPTLNQRGSRR